MHKEGIRKGANQITLVFRVSGKVERRIAERQTNKANFKDAFF
jgi:hypothetical protein